MYLEANHIDAHASILCPTMAFKGTMPIRNISPNMKVVIVIHILVLQKYDSLSIVGKERILSKILFIRVILILLYFLYIFLLIKLFS